MTNELTKEEMDEFKKLRDWVSKCPVEAAMKIQELESESNELEKELSFQTQYVQEYKEQNKRYREGIDDIKHAWKLTKNYQEHIDVVHDIIKDLESGSDER